MGYLNWTHRAHTKGPADILTGHEYTALTMRERFIGSNHWTVAWCGFRHDGPRVCPIRRHLQELQNIGSRFVIKRLKGEIQVAVWQYRRQARERLELAAVREGQINRKFYRARQLVHRKQCDRTVMLVIGLNNVQNPLRM